MTKLSTSMARAAVLATLVGGVALSAPTFAAPIDTTAPMGPPNSTINLDSQGDVTGTTPDTDSGKAPDQMTPPSGAMMHHDHPMHGGMIPESPVEMKKHVEMHIKTLHDQLKITKDQEPAWADVANAMRDSETGVADLVMQRKQNAGAMTAVDDMESYQKVIQAHADGFAKVITAFKTLYNAMPDAQKKNADMVFSSSYAKPAGHKGMHHKKMAQ